MRVPSRTVFPAVVGLAVAIPVAIPIGSLFRRRQGHHPKFPRRLAPLSRPRRLRQQPMRPTSAPAEPTSFETTGPVLPPTGVALRRKGFRNDED